MAIVVPVLYFARDTVAAVLPRASRLVFVSAVPAPDPALLVPLSASHTQPVKTAEPIAPFTLSAFEGLAKPAPVPEAAVARVEPKPVSPKQRQETPLEVETPKPTPIAAPPAARAVTVGTFAASVPSARTTDPVRTVQTAGFDAPAAHAAELKSASAVVGAFDASSTNARPGSDRAAVVADAGFGAMNAAAPAARQSRAVADAGFGGPAAAATRGTAPQEVRSAGFDAPPPTAGQAQVARPARVEVPVEILAKPTPSYTDEARAMKLEGEVVLDVEFGANGDVTVLRVVKGLGHGLDESAARAAQAIRFKPATASGRPVDFRSTVHIVFRLA